jgi:hypothetical protein
MDVNIIKKKIRASQKICKKIRHFHIVTKKCIFRQKIQQKKLF